MTPHETRPTRLIAGVDYSMTCPAVTIAYLDRPFTFESCRMYYLSEKPTKNVLPNIHSSRLGPYTSNEQRFEMISEWAMYSIIECGHGVVVYIEDYSFGSKGKTFHIAENTGMVKNKLWKTGYPINPIPPTVIKKFGHGKGNATKDQMYEAFVKETGVDLMKLYQPKAKNVGSPVGDLVDSYFICKYGYQQTLNTVG